MVGEHPRTPVRFVYCVSDRDMSVAFVLLFCLFSVYVEYLQNLFFLLFFFFFKQKTAYEI